MIHKNNISFTKQKVTSTFINYRQGRRSSLLWNEWFNGSIRNCYGFRGGSLFNQIFRAI